MMKYQLRDGVVLAELCHQPMLVATGPALDHCAYMSLMNDDAAFYLRLLANPQTVSQMAAAAAVQYEQSEETMTAIVEQFMDFLVQRGYVIQVNGDE